jgi:hypothetical protein
MPPTAPTLTDPRPGTWGVLRTGPPTPQVPETHARSLATTLGGLVTVGSEFPAASTLAVQLRRHATAAECLAAGIRELPSTAHTVVWFDGHAPAVDTATAVHELATRINGSDAALFAVPVSEAVKDIAPDGRVVRNVPREDLCVPVPPIVIRASIAREGLLELLDLGHDPVAALCVGGLAVRIVPTRPPAAL